MKKLLVALMLLGGFAYSYAQTYTDDNAKKDDVSFTAKVIAPITVQVVGPAQGIAPIVVKGATRTFTPVITKPTDFDTPQGFPNASSGNFGWLFKCTKQAGPENHVTPKYTNPNQDPYRVNVVCKVHDDGSTKLGLEGKWYFWERDSQLPLLEMLYTTLNEDFTTTWFADETEVLMAFYLTKINATNSAVTKGIKPINVTISLNYIAI